MGSLKKPFGSPLSPCLSSTHPLSGHRRVWRGPRGGSAVATILTLPETRENPMNKIPWITSLLLLILLPHGLNAQGLAIGARAGTLGFGGEVAFGVSDAVVLRGGFGVFPLEYEGEFDGEDYTVTFPKSMWSMGLDYYPGGGPIRIMAGVLGRSGDIELSSDVTESREIGGTVYTETGTLKGVLEQGTLAPFAGIGFGKHTAGGFSFFLDVGAALAGEADVTLSPEGALAAVPGIQQSLLVEADRVEDDTGEWLKVWPVVSVGVKLPLGVGY